MGDGMGDGMGGPSEGSLGYRAPKWAVLLAAQVRVALGSARCGVRCGDLVWRAVWWFGVVVWKCSVAAGRNYSV